MVFTEKLQSMISHSAIHNEEFRVDKNDSYEILSFGLINGEEDYIVTIVVYNDDEIDIMISKRLINSGLARIYNKLNELNIKYRCSNFFFDENYVTLRTSCNRVNGNVRLIYDELCNCINIVAEEFKTINM